MTAPDLDALEKLAESLATLDSEERDWPLVKIHGRMFHVENAAKAASDGLTALIAELKGARGLLDDLVCEVFDAITSDGEAQDCKAAELVDLVEMARHAHRAFLARNGKGEAPTHPRNAPRGLSDEC